MIIQVTDPKNNTVTMSSDEWDVILNMASDHDSGIALNKRVHVCLHCLYGMGVSGTDDGSSGRISTKHAAKLCKALNRVLEHMPAMGQYGDPFAQCASELKDLTLKLWFLARHGSLKYHAI